MAWTVRLLVAIELEVITVPLPSAFVFHSLNTYPDLVVVHRVPQMEWSCAVIEEGVQAVPS